MTAELTANQSRKLIMATPERSTRLRAMWNRIAKHRDRLIAATETELYE